MNISDNGLNLEKQFEGYRAKAYQDDAGVWTAGWGHTEGVTADTVCDLAQATAWLRADNQHAENAVTQLGIPLNQNRFDALCVWEFNTGGLWSKSGAPIRAALHQGNYAEAAIHMQKWIYVTDPVTKQKRIEPGLVRRRAAEVQLWSTPMVEGHVAPAVPAPPVPLMTDPTPAPRPLPPPGSFLQTTIGKALAGASFSGATGLLGGYTTFAQALHQAVNTTAALPQWLLLAAGPMALVTIGCIVWAAYHQWGNFNGGA